MRVDIQQAKRGIRRLQDIILDIQSKCPHNSKTTKYRGDTGNYDPTNDCYWEEYHCPDCDKHWTGNNRSAWR